MVSAHVRRLSLDLPLASRWVRMAGLGEGGVTGPLSIRTKLFAGDSCKRAWLVALSYRGGG